VAPPRIYSTMATTLPLPNVHSATGPGDGLRSAARRVALLSALATGLGIAFAWQTIVSLPPDRQATDWLHILVLQLVFWYIWVALTPAAFAVAERSRLDKLGTGWRVAAWLLLAVCVALVQTGLLHSGADDHLVPAGTASHEDLR